MGISRENDTKLFQWLVPGEYEIIEDKPNEISEDNSTNKKYTPKVGDIVKISNKSMYYKDNDISNPKIKGVITQDNIDFGDGYTCFVHWDNNRENCYRPIDLVVLKRNRDGNS